MTNESAQTTTNYAWQSLAMSTTGEYPTAMCTSKSNQLFSAAWNPATQKGYLQRWSVSQSKWITFPGKVFNSQINQMCCDTNGNIFLAGDTNAHGNYVIRILNIATAMWGEADNGYKYPMNYICCDSNNNVYVSGNFQNAGGHYCVMQYTPSSNVWTQLPGSGFSQPLTGLCISPNNTLFALEPATSGISISYWNGQQWTNITSPNLQTATSIGCDNAGNVYFNATSTIWSYNISTGVYTNLNAPIPAFSGTVVFTNLVWIDSILYFSITGYTGATALRSNVLVYAKGQWMDITPPNLNANNNAIIYDMACYTGKSHNVLLAPNTNCVYDGKKLIH